MRGARLRLEVSGIDPFIIALAALWLVGFGAAAASLAVRRRRRPRTWAIFGAVLGPVALGLLLLAPPGRCWTCTAPTVGWMTICPWCGEDVRGPAHNATRVGGPLPEGGRVHGTLTVIDGMAPGSPAEAAAAIGQPSRRSRETANVERLEDLGGEPASVDPGVEQPASHVDDLTAAAAMARKPERTAEPARHLAAQVPRAGQAVATAEALPAAAGLPEPRNVILASAVYMTGTRGLQAGSRYGIAIVGDDLRILGPVDLNPSAVAIVYPIGKLHATELGERLVITGGQGRRDQLTLVFMSIAGGTPEGVADAIMRAVADAGAARR